MSRAPKRVPFPRVTPKVNASSHDTGARYFLDIDGRAWREDGVMVKPKQRGKTINVKIQGGDASRSLVLAMSQAFATTPCPETSDEDGTWVPIIGPGTPIDTETLLPSCAARHIYWTPNSQACLWARQNIEPETLIPILK